MGLNRFLLFIGSMIQMGIGLNFHRPTFHHIAKLYDKQVQGTAVKHQVMDIQQQEHATFCLDNLYAA